MYCPPIIRLKRVIFFFLKVPKKILDDIVNIYRVKKYFSLDGWKKMSNILQTVEEESFWECPTCRRILDDKKPQIGCDACLEWFHLECIGKSRAPKAKSWICRACFP
jgi:hypothetical protein